MSNGWKGPERRSPEPVRVEPASRTVKVALGFVTAPVLISLIGYYGLINQQWAKAEGERKANATAIAHAEKQRADEMQKLSDAIRQMTIKMDSMQDKLTRLTVRCHTIGACRDDDL